MDTVSKLNKYRSVIQINDFIDFLYSQKIVNESNYYEVWNRVSITYHCSFVGIKQFFFQPERNRLHELFRILDTKNDLDCVFNYLKNNFPNIDKENEQERINRVISVRGGFPKLPPNYVTRKSLVSVNNQLQFFYYFTPDEKKKNELECYVVA